MTVAKEWELQIDYQNQLIERHEPYVDAWFEIDDSSKFISNKGLIANLHENMFHEMQKTGFADGEFADVTIEGIFCSTIYTVMALEQMGIEVLMTSSGHCGWNIDGELVKGRKVSVDELTLRKPEKLYIYTYNGSFFKGFTSDDRGSKMREGGRQ